MSIRHIWQNVQLSACWCNEPSNFMQPKRHQLCVISSWSSSELRRQRNIVIGISNEHFDTHLTQRHSADEYIYEYAFARVHLLFPLWQWIRFRTASWRCIIALQIIYINIIRCYGLRWRVSASVCVRIRKVHRYASICLRASASNMRRCLMKCNNSIWKHMEYDDRSGLSARRKKLWEPEEECTESLLAVL